MESVIQYLNDPNHVAAFQKHFGMERKCPSPAATLKNGKDRPESAGSETSEWEDEPGDYEVRNRFWFWLFSLGSAIGSEVFYVTVFPFWFWNVDGAVGRRVINIWGLSMFVGQCLKDIICWPRPACPPVVRVEEKWALEYGPPSTHALVSVTVPFSVILLTAGRYEYNVQLGFAVGIIWCTLVSSSRLYMGMHSLLDLISGWLLGLVLLVVLLPFVDRLDTFLLTHPASPGILASSAVTLMLIYPGSKYSSAKEDTAVILGSVAGLQTGAWLSYQLGSIRGPAVSPPYPVLWPSYEMLGLSLLRTIIGLMTVLATRAAAKSASYAALQTFGPSSGNEQSGRLTVKLVCKLLTYAAIGININWFSPAVFRLLGIERPTFHTEI